MRFEKNIVYLKPNMSPLIVHLMRQMMDDDVIFCYERYNKIYPFCEGKLNANGHPISINKCIDIKKQQYLCKKCNENFITDIDLVDKNSCYMKEISLQGLNIGLIDYMSLKK
ncbi:hypothetical protein [Methanobrevibacter cuticularis]|uniref:hypothetical protein n=1 Tax=Methanobrevibacter cuticularis TaxID=47311 RepID=UPI0012ED6AF5|nr:hypothetical protein [Methanobrevibacter cuticularis]